MNDHFIRSLPLVASALGRKYGLQVIIGGNKAGTDGDTIILPALPLDSPPELMGLARGFLDHEAAHVRDTDLDLVKKSRLIPVEHQIFNTIEDWRVEKVLGEKYPGCRENFQWLIWRLFGNQPINDNSPPDIDILNWLLLKMRSWSVPELSAQADQLAQKITSQIPGVIGKLESILPEIKKDCPDTKAAIAYARRIMKMLRDLLQPLEGQANGQAQNGVGDGSASHLQSQVVQVSAGGSESSPGKRDSQEETQSAGSSQSQPGGAGDAGGAGNSSDSQCQSEKTDPGQQGEDAQKQPQTSPSDGDLQPEKEAGQDEQGDDSQPDTGDSSGADGHGNSQEDDQTDSQDDSQPDDPSDSQADSQRDDQAISQEDDSADDQADGQKDSQDDSQNADQADDQEEDKPDSQADSQRDDPADNQDDAQADDQNASILNSLLARSAPEMPQSIGEILADLLNESCQNPTCGVLEVARLGPKTFPELDDYDLKETRITSLALKCRLTNLLQSMTLKKVQAGYQGRLDTNRLNRLFVHDPKVFRRSGSRIGLDTAVHLLLDASGSMNGWPIKLVSLSAYAFCEALSEVRGISIGATVFPGGDPAQIVKKRRSLGGSETVAPILDHGQRLHRKFQLFAGGGTPMGEAIWWVMQKLSARKEKRKLILILTDGQPDNYTNAVAAISEAHRQGLELFGLGLKDDSIKRLLPGKSLVISDLNELPKTIFQLLGRVMSQHHGGLYGNY